MPGPFNLDHLHPFEPLLSCKFSNFFTFILGGQFLLPQRSNYEKREIIQLQNWLRQAGFQYLGHSNWAKCSPLSSYCAIIIPPFSLSYPGGQFLLPQRSNNQKREFFQLQKLNETWACAGGIKLDHLQTIKPLLFPNFSNFSIFILGGLFLLPQRDNNQKRAFSNPKIG